MRQHTPDPRLQQLASEAAQKIKAITSERDEQIQQIYQEYRKKAEAITGTSDSLTASADSQPHPHRASKRQEHS